MDYLIELLSGYIQNEALLRIVFVAFVAIAVFASGTSLIYLFTAIYNPIRRRLAGIADFETDSNNAKPAGTSTSLVNRDSYLSEKLDGVAKYILPKGEKEKNSVKAKLIRAGFRDEGTIRVYYAIKTLLCVAFGFIAILVTSMNPELTANQVAMAIIGSAFLGLALPNFVLNRLEETRIKRIRRGFPDALDLMVVCVESGLGLTATIQRVGVEMEVSHPELADEFDLVTAEMRLGVDRITALRGLAVRTGLDEIKGLVALLDQSVRFGTGIAETLRVYSDEFRDKRMQAAEEIAAKIGTKMIFPLTFFMWPAFFVVAVGPAILGVLEIFK